MLRAENLCKTYRKHAVSVRVLNGLDLEVETGEFLTGAMALYRKYGFEECEQWGEYVGVPLSYCMSLRLDYQR